MPDGGVVPTPTIARKTPQIDTKPIPFTIV